MTDIKVVIGANFGDEGKGLATATFAAKAHNGVIVLTNGSAQRGHTVESRIDSEIKRHVFHHFGASCPTHPIDTFIPSQYSINPIEFIREFAELNAQKWPIGNVYVHPDAIVTTPYDMIVNRVLETNRGAKRHGSTGMGYWATLCRDKEIHITYLDVIKETVEQKISDIIEFSVNSLKQDNAEIPEDYAKILFSDGLRKHFLEDAKLMAKLTAPMPINKFRKYDTIIFENSQGLLLSDDGSDDPFKTPSFTGLDNVQNITDEFFEEDEIGNIEVCYVTRPYLTRHGVGPFKEECDKNEIGKNIIDVTNQSNEWQGSLRYGFLNTDELIKRIDKDFAKCRFENKQKSIMVTHCNERTPDEELINKATYKSSNKFVEDTASLR